MCGRENVRLIGRKPQIINLYDLVRYSRIANVEWGHVSKTAGRHGGFETLQLSTQAAADVHRRSGSQHEFLRGTCCDQASSASPALARTGDGRQTEYLISRRVSAAWGEIC